jgi:Raf kinase inhibitor-like YbhB/YbcL family protein
MMRFAVWPLLFGITLFNGGNAMAFSLTSPAFTEGGAIPATYTCDGENLSPPLSWAGAPEGTQGFALIVDDPDAHAGPWVHWVVFGLPAAAHELPAGAALPGGARAGRNDSHHTRYDGPCPPGGTHHYVFKLYALDAAIALPAGATKKELERAMAGHVLAEARLTGTYARR